MRMPQAYQPPKFQQFDGSGNPKQHITHFIETCGSAGTEGDLLVKQFVRSLKDIAFDWYTDLEAESIDSWNQMEDEFLKRFFNTKRIVSLNEVANTRQREDEPVVDYINRWRSLSLECKEHIKETSAVEMCIDGMNWDLLYILKGIRPRSFQELATRAHDMEMTIKHHTTSSKSSAEEYITSQEPVAINNPDTNMQLDDDDEAEANQITVTTSHDALLQQKEVCAHKIRFGSSDPPWTQEPSMEAEPTEITRDKLQKNCHTCGTKLKNALAANDDEEWIAPREKKQAMPQPILFVSSSNKSHKDWGQATKHGDNLQVDQINGKLPRHHPT